MAKLNVDFSTIPSGAGGMLLSYRNRRQPEGQVHSLNTSLALAPRQNTAEGKLSIHNPNRQTTLISGSKELLKSPNQFHKTFTKGFTGSANRGQEPPETFRESIQGTAVGKRGADLYLPHLRPKLSGTVHSTRNSTQFNSAQYQTYLQASVNSSEGGSQYQSPRDYGKSPDIKRNVFSPILKQKEREKLQLSTAVGDHRTGSNAHSVLNGSAQNLRATLDETGTTIGRKYKVSVHDMVASSKKNGLEMYGLPNFPEGRYPPFDARFDRPVVFGMSKDAKQRDFITEYRKLHKLDPGPIYKVEYDMSQKSAIKENSPRFSITQGKVPSHMDKVVAHAKAVPGVGKYDLLKAKKKIKGTYTIKVAKSGFTDEAIFYGQSTPSHYPAVDPNFYKTTRQPMTKLMKPLNEKEGKNRIDKVVKNNSPSIHHYEVGKSFDRSAKSPRSIEWSIPKGKKQLFIDRETKVKAKVPGVGHYNVDTAYSHNRVTIGARGRIGYYSRK